MIIVYAWRWLGLAATGSVVGTITEVLARRMGAPTLAPPAGISAAGLAASIAGLYLFPPLLPQSPHPVTISVVGAFTYAALWVAAHTLHLRTSEVCAKNCLRLAGACLLLGVLGGVVAGTLSCRPLLGAFYCAPFGLLGGALLAIPYLTIAFHARRRARDRKNMVRHDRQNCG